MLTVCNAKPPAELRFRKSEDAAVVGNLRHGRHVGMQNALGFLLRFGTEGVEQCVSVGQAGAAADIHNGAANGFTEEVRQPESRDSVTIQVFHVLFPFLFCRYGVSCRQHPARKGASLRSETSVASESV